MTSVENPNPPSSKPKGQSHCVVALGWTAQTTTKGELDRLRTAGYDVRLLPNEEGIAQPSLSPAMILIRQCDEHDFSTDLLLLRTRFRGSRIYCCSLHPTLPLLMRAFLIGVDGFLDSRTLEKAVRAVTEGVVLTQTPARLLTQFLKQIGKAHSLQQLSNREIETLALLAQGAPDKVIAEELHVSLATVHTHVARLLKKLGIHSRAEARERFFQILNAAFPKSD